MARATATEGGVQVIVTLSHIDQVYVLQEALAGLAEKIEPTRQWRAAAAVEDLLAQLDQLSEQELAE
jgi:hypothetical protein